MNRAKSPGLWPGIVRFKRFLYSDALRAAPPPLRTTTRGRPRQVDTSDHCCPDPRCGYYGWVGRGNIRANGHPSDGRWRQLQCTVCHGYFQETHGTPLHGKRVWPQRLVWAVGALAEGAISP